MPTPKQMEKLANAAAVGRNAPPARTPGPSDEMPAEYWQAVLDDATPPGPSIRTQRLSEIQRHLLRVGCRRCGRTVEIQKLDAGADAVWPTATGRHLRATDRPPRRRRLLALVRVVAGASPAA
jgi:hypothetical protein